MPFKPTANRSAKHTHAKVTHAKVTHAMVLAAGLGTRMRPLTDSLPKPLVRLSGRTLLDHALDRLAEVGIEDVIVNVHYLAEQIEAHIEQRRFPKVVISDERHLLLETGGGVRKALPSLGPDPFLVFNSDSVWNEGETSNLKALMEAWRPGAMSALLLLAAKDTSLGFDGRGDFFFHASLPSKAGPLERRGQAPTAPYVFAGVSILKPDLFDAIDTSVFSLNLAFDEAARRGELYGLVLDGVWMHVGSPGALEEAERYLKTLGPNGG